MHLEEYERTIERTLCKVNGKPSPMRYADSRPHLRALLRDDGEAHLLVAELGPRERTKRVERRGEFYSCQSLFTWLCFAPGC